MSREIFKQQKKCILIYIVFLVCSCSVKDNHKLNNNYSKNDSIISSVDEDVIESESKEDFVRLRHDIENSYEKTMSIDTAFIFEAKNIKFKSIYSCDKFDSIIIPSEYLWEKDLNQFKTYGFQLDVLILRNNDTLLKEHITKKDFYEFFRDNEELKKYGVLMNPTKTLNRSNGSLITLSTNVAIPLTDIGKGFHIDFYSDRFLIVPNW